MRLSTGIRRPLRGLFFLALFLAAGYGLYRGIENGCFSFSRVGLVNCRAEDPLGYWLDLLFTVLLGLFSLVMTLASFLVESPPEESERALLERWLKEQRRSVFPPVTLPPACRSCGVALLWGSLLFGLWLAIFSPLAVSLGLRLFAIAVVISLPVLLALVLGSGLSVDKRGLHLDSLLFPPRSLMWQDMTGIKLSGWRDGRRLVAWGRGWGRFELSTQGSPHFWPATALILEQARLQRNVEVSLPPEGLAWWLKMDDEAT